MYLQSQRRPRETLHPIYSAACTWGRIWLAARLKKTNECSQTKLIVPYRLVHSPAHLPQSWCLPFCHFISGNSSSGIWEECQSTGSLFETPKRMNGSHYSHWVMNNVLTWQATVMYHPSSYMWHIEMIGVTAGSDGFCSAEGAYVQRLNCRAGIHLKVGLKVKLKGCGAWLFQGCGHIKSVPKVLFLSCVKWHRLQRQNYK